MRARGGRAWRSHGAFPLATGLRSHHGQTPEDGMNPNIEALLELQVIDKQRQSLRKARQEKLRGLDEARKAAEAKKAAAVAAAEEIEKMAALIRQYEGDLQRCDATIADLRGKQMNAKTNKEYMAIINGIEQSRLEKGHREQSLKELAGKVDAAKAKAAAAQTEADQAAAKAEAAATATGATEPGSDETALEQQYAERKAKVDPKFLEAYERLVTAGHKTPLVKVDQRTRALPWGAVISMNQLEQIIAGRLVIASGTNQILYV